MQPKTIIFIGPQGSGKGTQVKLLKEKLAEVDSKHFITHIQTGKPFREIASAGGYTSELVKKLINSGEMIPDVLTNAFVITEFVDEHVDNAHILLDGYPRNEAQAMACVELFTLYGRSNIDIIHLDTKEEVVMERMLERGREDDTEAAITERLRQYHAVTEPLLEFYTKQDNATVHVVDGGLAIEDVQTKLREILNIV